MTSWLLVRLALLVGIATQMRALTAAAIGVLDVVHCAPSFTMDEDHCLALAEQWLVDRCNEACATER